MATISDLLPQIFDRVEENPKNPIFWTLNEAVFAAIEAMNDLMLMVGRPTQIVNQPFDIVPNTPWQKLPAGMFAITDIQGYSSQVYKYTLEDFDYLQVSSGSDWENDIADEIHEWAPLGLNRFVVHPSVAHAQTVTLTGIATPCTQLWPYDPTTITVPFEDEFLQALEKYAAHYLRFAEGSNEFTESYKIYQSYLDDAKRMTELEDRDDPLLFTMGYGGQTRSNFSTAR